MSKANNKVIYKTFTNLTLRKELDNSDYATLQWGLRNYYPRITVYTSKHVKDSKNQVDYSKVIIAPFDINSFGILLNNIEKFGKLYDEKKVGFSINCYNLKFKDGKKSDEKYVQSQVHFYKDSELVNTLAIKENDNKLVEFKLLPGEWHKYYDKEGKEITDKKLLSIFFTNQYIQNVKFTYHTEFALNNTKINEVTNDKDNIVLDI